MTPSPDFAILRHLAARTQAGAAEIGSHLVSLESRRFITSRSDKAEGKPRRIYFITTEGRRAAGVSDARHG